MIRGGGGGGGGIYVVSYVVCTWKSMYPGYLAVPANFHG